MENKSAVEMRGVSVYYGDYAVLEKVDLDVKDRGLLAVIGPNGGGKSTLLKVILGLITPSEGTVRVFGKSPRDARGFVGYLPQYKTFDSTFPISVSDVVLAGRYDKSPSRYSDADRKAAEEALSSVGMDQYSGRQIGRLSGGQIQRVLLARALARKPRLLLLDEPTASIDPEMQKSFYELMAGLKKEIAIVLVTHDVGAISSYVDDVACLNRRLFSHGEGVGDMEHVYSCPIDLISHGTPHRVFKEHDV